MTEIIILTKFILLSENVFNSVKSKFLSFGKLLTLILLNANQVLIN